MASLGVRPHAGRGHHCSNGTTPGVPWRSHHHAPILPSDTNLHGHAHEIKSPRSSLSRHAFTRRFASRPVPNTASGEKAKNFPDPEIRRPTLPHTPHTTTSSQYTEIKSTPNASPNTGGQNEEIDSKRQAEDSLAVKLDCSRTLPMLASRRLVEVSGHVYVVVTPPSGVSEYGLRERETRRDE